MHTRPSCATYIKVSSNKDSPSYIILKYRYFWLKFIAPLCSAFIVRPPCCLLACVLWRIKSHGLRKNYLPCNSFIRRFLCMRRSDNEFGHRHFRKDAAILGQASREVSTSLYLRYRNTAETPLTLQVIYLTESNKNRQIKWLKHESGKSYSATR